MNTSASKNILMLTTIYPSPDFVMLNNTDVCHFFSKEWVKMGYKVKVIYNYPRYWSLFHFVASFLGKRLASITGVFIAAKKINNDKQYLLDDVVVERFPLYKPLPRGRFPKKSILKQIQKIKNSNQSDGFLPDVIVGHFHNPSLEMVYELKKVYPQAKTALVLHGNGDNIKTIYKNRYKKLMNSVDFFGHRSLALKRNFETSYGVQQHTSFMCYSGIPEGSFQNAKPHANVVTKNFIFVGSLIKRKHPASILPVLYTAFPNKDFSMTYVGSGQEEKKMRKIKTKLGLEENVRFKGRLPREHVFEELKSAECFIMLSENETFGLVYIEAMANGCITIASKDEGMDGIITHGVNGFLCKAGNEKELAELIIHINTLSLEEKLGISQRAIETAQEMTDFQVAKNYIESILN